MTPSMVIERGSGRRDRYARRQPHHHHGSGRIPGLLTGICRKKWPPIRAFTTNTCRMWSRAELKMFSRETIRALQAMGHIVNESERTWGLMNMVSWDRKTNTLHAGSGSARGNEAPRCSRETLVIASAIRSVWMAKKCSATRPRRCGRDGSSRMPTTPFRWPVVACWCRTWTARPCCLKPASARSSS